MEVCPNVCVEPTLQPLTGESFPIRSTNTKEGARLDIKAQNFRANNKPSSTSESSTPTHHQTAHPPMLATEDMNARRGEYMNTVCSRWSMVLLWSCPQVEVGVHLPQLLSRVLQVSSLRNTTNHTAAPSASSDVRSPLA